MVKFQNIVFKVRNKMKMPIFIASVEQGSSMPGQCTKKESGMKCGKEVTKQPLFADNIIACRGNTGQPMNHNKKQENKY